MKSKRSLPAWLYHRARLFTLLVGLLLLCGAGAARADSCSVSMPDVNFGSVSPITTSDIVTQAVGTISCTWSLNLSSNASICVTAGFGGTSVSANPRTMNNGSNLMQYNLYRVGDYAAASIWGGPGVAGATTPFTTTLLAPGGILGGTKTQNFTVYAKIPAGTSLAAVKTVSNGDTVYSALFGGTISYSYYGGTTVSPCTGANTASFAFTAQATATNNCTITTSPLSFGSPVLLSSAVRSTSTLSVQCVNANGYQIALNGGTVANNVGARAMKNAANADTVSYQLSATLDGPLWGDGTGATTKYTGTGTGALQSITLFGMVPAQGTPSPGNYKDTVTATIYF